MLLKSKTIIFDVIRVSRDFTRLFASDSATAMFSALRRAVSQQITPNSRRFLADIAPSTSASVPTSGQGILAMKNPTFILLPKLTQNSYS